MVIPGHANNGFLLAEAEAESVVVYDKDPKTIAWIKAIKKYYNYRVGRSGSLGNLFIHGFSSSAYFGAYWKLMDAIRDAVRSDPQGLEWDKNIQFYVGDIDRAVQEQAGQAFDVVFTPFLLGVENGIGSDKEIAAFVERLRLIAPRGHLLVTPSRRIADGSGEIYFKFSENAFIGNIPGLVRYFAGENKQGAWGHGLAVFDLSRHNKKYAMASMGDKDGFGKARTKAFFMSASFIFLL